MRDALINIVLIALLLFPVKSFSAGAVKYMHIMSVYSDEAGAALKNPEGVACNNESLIVVADTANHRLLRYTLQDKTLTGGSEISVPESIYPVRVDVNSIGVIFFLDRKKQRIGRIGPDGEFIGYLEVKSLPSKGSVVPRSFYIDNDDNIYVLDIFSARVIVLNPEGEYVKEAGFPADYGFISDVTVDLKGNILLTDSIHARVYTSPRGSSGFSPLTGTMHEQIRFPADAATDNRGRIYLVDHNGSRIIVIGQEGSYLGQISERGWKEGLLNYPSQICINDKGDLVIADTDNNRVQIFRLIK